MASLHITLTQEVQNAGKDIRAATGHAPSYGTAQAAGGIWALVPGLQHLDGGRKIPCGLIQLGLPTWVQDPALPFIMLCDCGCVIFSWLACHLCQMG